MILKEEFLTMWPINYENEIQRGWKMCKVIAITNQKADVRKQM